MTNKEMSAAFAAVPASAGMLPIRIHPLVSRYCELTGHALPVVNDPAAPHPAVTEYVAKCALRKAATR